MSVTTMPGATAAQETEEAPRVHPARPEAAPPDDAPDLRALLNSIWRRKWIVLVFMLVGGLAACGYLLTQENRYSASARIIFEPERLRIIDLNSVVSADLSNTAIRNEIEMLRSAIVLERVVDTLRLERADEFNPALRGDPLDGHRLARLVDGLDLPPLAGAILRQLGLLPPPRLSGSPDEQAASVRTAIVETLMRELRLRPIPETRVVEIAFASRDPVLAAAIVNAAAEQYIIVQTERKRDDVAQATELLSARVSDLESRLSRADEAVQVAELELAMSAEHGSTLVSGQIDFVTQNLAAATELRTEIEARYQLAQDVLETGGDILVVPEFRNSEVIAAYRTRAVDLLDQEASLRSVAAGRNNPSLVRLQARIAEVRRSIDEEAQRIIASLAVELDSARSAEARLTSDRREIEQRGLEQARAEMRLTRLQREADAVRTMYDTFLARMNETTEQAALQAADARFLTRASAPLDPDTRHALLILLGIVLMAAGLGTALILLIERMNDTFRRTSDVEQATGLNVLAGIPRIPRQGEPKRLLAHFLASPSAPLAESARNLRTSILFSNLDQAPRVIMIASSLPGEGKTTTAMLTAVTSQQMERSAIIVDCDLRRGTLGRMFPRSSQQPGLFAALQGTSSVEECVFVEPETGLHVLAPERVGQGFGNPADILASRRFQRLIAQLKARYDLVILDTPPVLAVSDPRIVAQVADAVVYLVSWNRTRRGAVLEGLRDLHSVNAPIAGVALTLVDERQARKYLDSEYLYKPSYG